MALPGSKLSAKRVPASQEDRFQIPSYKLQVDINYSWVPIEHITCRGLVEDCTLSTRVAMYQKASLKKKKKGNKESG